MRAVLAGRDVLAVMPTGSGKSLGYQLPAVILPGLTLVVSPLIALMKDQVDELNRKGIRAAALHSLASREERRAALAGARNGDPRLLYVAPERFASEAFARDLSELRLSRFAVDEAHCVSEWGTTSVDYRRLAVRRADAAGPTARKAAADHRLHGHGDAGSPRRHRVAPRPAEPEVFVAGFDRPNIFFDVRRVSGELEKRALLPELVGSGRALVYAATRKSAERASDTLRAAGVQAEAYHAGLDEAERSASERLRRGQGARRLRDQRVRHGIDRPDIEAVVHFEIPGSLGGVLPGNWPGGRDGRPAQATLLWNYVDVRTREYFIEKEDDEPDLLRPRAARPGAAGGSASSTAKLAA